MRSTFRILFYVRKNYVNKSGKVGIMVRITLNGEISQFSSKLDIDPKSWNTKSGRVIGKSSQANQLNATLDEIRASIVHHYREIERQESHVTAEKIRNTFLGVTVKKQMLLQIFRQHNDEMSKLVGVDKSKDTLQKYQRTYRCLESFMKYQYTINDIALKEINYSFITGFETYLRTECSCGINTTAKYIQRFKHIIIIAKSNGWIQSDPFFNFKIRLEKVDRGYLTEEELSAIMNKKFILKRLEQVRDLFVFSCFTGLAYIDVYSLRERHIRKSFDERLWVMKKRKKTGVQSNILLLDVPKMILKKYKDKFSDGKVLPVLSNQKMNAYLKEIADFTGIKKNLTFHLARHTFATTVTLAKGVPMETVSKMLGHTSIRTTQIYARITDSKIGNDMQELSKKLQGMDKMLTI
jgi:site-specific recombinase XerD